MAINCVVPSQQRKFRPDGRFHEFYTPPRYHVDGDAIPELVARGVMPFRFLEMRKDFGSRFKACSEAADVIRVLKSEGYYE